MLKCPSKHAHTPAPSPRLPLPRPNNHGCNPPASPFPHTHLLSTSLHFSVPILAPPPRPRVLDSDVLLPHMFHRYDRLMFFPWAAKDRRAVMRSTMQVRTCECLLMCVGVLESTRTTQRVCVCVCGCAYGCVCACVWPRPAFLSLPQPPSPWTSGRCQSSVRARLRLLSTSLQVSAPIFAIPHAFPSPPLPRPTAPITPPLQKSMSADCVRMQLAALSASPAGAPWLDVGFSINAHPNLSVPTTYMVRGVRGGARVAV